LTKCRGVGNLELSHAGADCGPSTGSLGLGGSLANGGVPSDPLRVHSGLGAQNDFLRAYCLVLHLYLDETGDSNDSTFFGLSGCLSTLGGWHHFEEEWNERILKSLCLTFFHMTDFEAVPRHKPYVMNQALHNAYVNTTIDIVSKSVDSCVGMVTEIAEPQKSIQIMIPTMIALSDC